MEAGTRNTGAGAVKFEKGIFRLKDSPRAERLAMGIGIVGIALSGLGWMLDSVRFYHAWLTAFSFWVSIALGALFFTMLHHLTGAKWSVVVRRISETIMMQLPWMFLAFIPIYLGMHDLYHWTHEEAVANDLLLQNKAGYLNVGFFTARTILYFAVWSAVSIMLYRTSLRQDSRPSEAQLAKMRKVSAGGMLLFALTITFASFDWLMSMEPHWFSTIFGVYFFACSFLASISFLTGICLYLRNKNVLTSIITVEHFHDLGKLMFAFTVFWSYIAFSQYLLIWYGNIPEETYWYLMRWEGSWKYVSLVIIFGHFAIPFTLLLFQGVKRNMMMLKLMAAWLLLVHWLDMYWLVYPSYLEHGAEFGWIEPATMIGLGGIFLWSFWSRLRKNPLVPTGDPHLETSIKFVNQ